MIDLDQLKDALNARAGHIVRALIGTENGALSNAANLRFGRKGSLSVKVAGDKAGCWYDHEAGTGGDLLGLIQRERGGSFKDAIEFARQHLGHVATAPAACIVTAKTHAKRHAEKEANKQVLALELWQEARAVHETLAAAYLASRGITTIPDGVDDAIRFHPAGYSRGKRVPMLLGLFRDIVTDEPRAVHRIVLSPAARKVEGLTLGPKSGAAIKLTADAEVTQGLVIGEGIETVLSAMMLGLRPAWALGGVTPIGAFPVLPGLDALTILIDNDIKGVGQKHSAACRDRWLAAGREMVTVMPNAVGHDMNDLLLGVRP